QDLDKGQAQAELVQLYVYNAVDQVQKKAKEAIISASSGDEQRMMLMGLKRFTKYHEYPNIVGLRERIAERVIAANTYPF
ncbi:acyl-CoA dehydrogenase, partial [Flavobacteriaceae bacterium]|nr:acyl-CoA dehydrogenase [Flavobacteriaceae bacterium]